MFSELSGVQEFQGFQEGVRGRFRRGSEPKVAFTRR